MECAALWSLWRIVQPPIAVATGAVELDTRRGSAPTPPRLSRVSDPHRFRPFATSLDSVNPVAPLLFSSRRRSTIGRFTEQAAKSSCGTIAVTRSSWISINAKTSRANGESGAGHRRCDPAWVREVRNYCVDEGVASVHELWGGRTPKSGGRTLNGRTREELSVQGKPQAQTLSLS